MSKAFAQQIFSDGFPAQAPSPDVISFVSWEIVLLVTAVILMMWTFGVLYLYGKNPTGLLRHWFFPHRVSGLFLRTDVEVMGGVRHAGKTVTQRRRHVIGYLTSISENTAKFISDEKVPVGSLVQMRLTALPDNLGADKAVQGVVRSSQQHTSRGSFFETKVDVQAIPEESREGFNELLDTLEANYTAA